MSELEPKQAELERKAKLYDEYGKSIHQLRKNLGMEMNVDYSAEDVTDFALSTIKELREELMKLWECAGDNCGAACGDMKGNDCQKALAKAKEE